MKGACLAFGANRKVWNKACRTPWNNAKDNETLKGSAAYWRLNDARFCPGVLKRPAAGRRVMPGVLW